MAEALEKKPALVVLFSDLLKPVDSCMSSLSNYDMLLDRSINGQSRTSGILNHLPKHTKLRKIPRTSGFVEETVPRFNTLEFKMRFRMMPTAFEKLMEDLGPRIKNKYEKPDQIIRVDKQALIFLYFAATQVPLIRVADAFAVCEATVFNIVGLLSRILVGEMMQNYIKWPTGHRIQEVWDGFAAAQEFPKVIGAVDGTHIPIKTPIKDQEIYINRKKCHSINVCAICDHQYMFTDITVGWPGSCHDSRVFKNSNLYRDIQSDAAIKHATFPDNSHLLGDSAYELDTFLMVPFKDNGHLTRMQKDFNYKLSSTRMMIENTFGILKGRFRRLKYIDMHDERRLLMFITSCFVLHNVCILLSDDANDYLHEVQLLAQEENPDQVGGFLNPTAVQKRYAIATMLSL